MIARWVLLDTSDNTVHTEGYVSAEEAWKAQVELARKFNRSPYEWTMFEVKFEVK